MIKEKIMIGFFILVVIWITLSVIGAIVIPDILWANLRRRYNE